MIVDDKAKTIVALRFASSGNGTRVLRQTQRPRERPSIVQGCGLSTGKRFHQAGAVLNAVSQSIIQSFRDWRDEKQ